MLPTDYQAFIAASRYARFLDHAGRREYWHETVSRYMDNVVRPKIKDEDLAQEIEKAILDSSFQQ